MPKLTSESISDSAGAINSGESFINDNHWKKITGKKEKDILTKLKIKNDNRTKKVMLREWMF